MFIQDSHFLIDRLRKINIDNKHQLRRLRSEVEHICKEQNIELTTKCKRISCVPYIKELISKIKNIEKKIDQKNVKIYSKLKIHRQKKLNKEKEIKAHKKYYFKYFIWSPIISIK